MKYWILTASLTLVACALLVSQPSAAVPKPEDAIIKLEQDWLSAEAAADMPALRRLIADDFMGTAFGPGVLTKADVVPTEGGPENRMPKSSLGESTVRVFGDTAVLMGSIATQGQPPMRITTVFQKRSQGWQMIATHMSREVEAQ